MNSNTNSRRGVVLRVILILCLVAAALAVQLIAPASSLDNAGGRAAASGGRAAVVAASRAVVQPQEAAAYNCLHVYNSRSSGGPFWVSKTRDGARTKVNPGSGSGCSGDWFYTGCLNVADRVSDGRRVFGCSSTYLGIGWQGTTVNVHRN